MCVVVVIFVVVISATFVLVLGFSRVRCLIVCSWLICRCRVGGGRGSCWLLESAAYKIDFHGVPCQAVLCPGESCRS